MQRFRIMPLLVLVAMLAFSVRLADVFLTLPGLSGSAHAQHEVEAEPPPMPETAQAGSPPEGGLVFEDDTQKEEETAGEEKFTIKDETPLAEWKDAGDSDLDYTAVRMELFEDLAARRKEIESREKNVMTREALLKAAEQELDRKFQELDQLRAELERLLQQQSSEETARIESLVKVYEGMKPKDAARIFDTLDLDILLEVTARMSERKLSPVLASMNPERARTITIMLAEQKQLPELPGSQ